MQYKLEIVAYDLESCMAAQHSGAHRIELCVDPVAGGTTPSYGLIQVARSQLQIPLYPIIRPRGGDFLYSHLEFEVMKKDVRNCKILGCDGVVIGILNADGTIDKTRCSQLIQLAYPMGVTFHRAFDRAADPSLALEDMIDIGCERLLTSGLRPNAQEGQALIASLILQAAGRIIVMPGSGIRAANIKEIALATGATELHSSAATSINSQMEYRNALLPENAATPAADSTEIKKMLEMLQQLSNEKTAATQED